MDKTSLFSTRPKRAAAFSLVEVALAIGIVAFAFVALFSLIPTGLQKFRDSIDTASETWIMQGLNSMVQTTEWEKVYAPTGTSELSKDTYYFDEEARLTDTKDNPSNDPQVVQRRLYAARLFVFPMQRPGTDAEAKIFTRDGTAPTAVHVVAAMTRYVDKTANDELDNLTTAGIQNLTTTTRLHVRSFVASQMNSAR